MGTLLTNNLKVTKEANINNIITTSITTIDISATNLITSNITTYSINCSGNSIFDHVTINNNLVVDTIICNYTDNVNISSNVIIYKLDVNDTATITNLTVVEEATIEQLTVNDLVLNQNTLPIANLSINNIPTSSIIVKDIFQLSNVYGDIGSIDQTINMYAHVINIGTNNSIIKFNGTTQNVYTQDLVVNDKIITLKQITNVGSMITGNIGTSCGIEIIGTNGDGFIKPDNLATRYLIKDPVSNDINFITVQDSNNNLNISGIATLYGNVDIKGSTLLHNTFKLHNVASIDIPDLTPQSGDIIYNSTTNKLNMYTLDGWEVILTNE